MKLSPEQYEARVKGLEAYARAKPGGYRLRVALLAALGYLYVLLILVLVLGLLGLCVWILVTLHSSAALARPILFLAILAFIILRALWVRFPRPEGIPVTRDQAPALFQMMDEIAARLKAPRPDNVLITDDFNAMMAQTPRYGLLGGHVSYLILGLPYLLASPPEHVRGTVAHELGHLSGDHSRFNGRVFLVRSVWEQLLSSFEGSSGGSSFFLVGFLRWYAPFFSLYTFVMARANEYEADRREVEVTGAATAVESLISITLRSRQLAETFWPEVYRQANDLPEPPAGVYRRLAKQLKAGPSTEQAKRWLIQALRAKTDYNDTHPSLTERLAAIGCLDESGSGSRAGMHADLSERLSALNDGGGDPGSLLPSDAWHETAAERFLGGMVAPLMDQLERQWQQAILLKWGQRYVRAQKEQARLHELSDLALERDLTEEEAWQRAKLTEEYVSGAAARPLYQEMIEINAADAPALFALGQILLEEEDEAGVAMIRQAITLDPHGTLAGCKAMYSYLMKTGRMEEAQQWRERYQEVSRQEEIAARERGYFSPSDVYLPHGLPPELVASFVALLTRIKGVRSVYLVRKQVKVYPERICYLLAVKTSVYQKGKPDPSVASTLRSQLDLPATTVIVMLTNQTAKLERRLRRTPSGLIYRHGR